MYGITGMCSQSCFSYVGCLVLGSFFIPVPLVVETALAASHVRSGIPKSRSLVQQNSPLHKPVELKPMKRRSIPSSVKGGEEAVRVSGSSVRRNGGGGMMRVETQPRSVQSVGKQYIAMRSPASTALALVENLPALNSISTDTSGMKGGAIMMRGMTDADMALLVDGAPNSLAPFIQQDVAAEDIESVDVTPGSTTVDMASAQAAAGALVMTTITPAKKAGGMMDFSYGTNNFSRQFVRLESGYIGNSGVRGYFAFAHAHARQWMGAGTSENKHIDFGLRKDFDGGSFMKLFVSWHNETMTIDKYPNEKEFFLYKHQGIGYNRTAEWDPDSANAGNFWKSNIDPWNQYMVTMPTHFVLTKRLSFDMTPYMTGGQGWDGASGGVASDGQFNYGNGQSVLSGQQLSSYYEQIWCPDVGFTSKINYKADSHNTLTFGYWYDNNSSHLAYPTMATEPNGKNPGTDNNAYKLFYGNGVRANTNVYAGYELHSFFIQDVAKYLGGKLIITPAFKFVMSNYWDKTFVGDPSGLVFTRMGGNTTAPLPHLAISYNFNDHHQLYVNAEGDFRQPAPTNLMVGRPLPRNQYSIVEQIGYRYNDRNIIFDISAFNYSITNRLMLAYLGNGNYGTLNGGNQTSRGFDVMIAGRGYHHFSPYASFEYLHATQDSNVPYGDSFLPTKGKQAIMAPHVMANFGVSYTSKGFFGNFSLHYVGPQSVTLVNDQRIPGYINDSLSVGYHFPSFFYAKSPTFQLNFTNLTGSVVRMGANGIATNRDAVRLVNGAYAPAGDGAAFYVMPRFSMTGTVSTSF